MVELRTAAIFDSSGNVEENLDVWRKLEGEPLMTTVSAYRDIWSNCHGLTI